MSVVLCLWAVTPALVCIFYFFHFSVGITLVSSDIMADVCPRLLDYIVVTIFSWLVLRPSYRWITTVGHMVGRCLVILPYRKMVTGLIPGVSVNSKGHETWQKHCWSLDKSIEMLAHQCGLMLVNLWCADPIYGLPPQDHTPPTTAVLFLALTKPCQVHF